MIEPGEFLSTLGDAGVSFFTGVPDSLLKHFIAVLARDHSLPGHVIAANEGTAVGLAAGHYVATGAPGLVYLQNSGLGNAVNPLMSLTSPDLYGIPMVLMIGWRGEPGIPDEPQHMSQGRITPDLLRVLDVETLRLGRDEDRWRPAIVSLVEKSRLDRKPVAVLVSAGVFASADVVDNSIPEWSGIPRQQALRLILRTIPEDSVVVATTGYTSRELYVERHGSGDTNTRDLLVVGSMGHASSVALGIALTKPDVTVVCLDGDGSMMMHMGALAQIGGSGPANLLHVVMNNGMHESVGGQPTVARNVDVCAVADACGYRSSSSIGTLSELEMGLTAALTSSGPQFMEIRINPGAPGNLARPDDLRQRFDSLRGSFDE
ncbi:MAG: phosphonopyruvate decarboxylase [Acidimicrobiia bacterium]